MRRATATVLAAAALVACDGSAASSTVATTAATRTTAPPPTAASGPTTATDDVATIVPEGFDRVQATVTGADGTVCEVCLWLAADDDRRRRGLMFVTDLGGGDGMAFVYARPRTGTFWMKNTVLPLSIAFFDADGVFLDAFDMEPCTTDPCPTYRTPTDFLVAVETVQGGLAELQMAPGSVLDLTELPCDDG